MNSARLFVALGALDQTSGGETFWPGHGGLVRDGSAPANLDGHTSPSLNAGEVNVNGRAVETALACAAATMGSGVWMWALEPFLLGTIFCWAMGAAERGESAAQLANVAANRAANNEDAENAKGFLRRGWSCMGRLSPNLLKRKTIPI
jgi:hypothetical protein